MSRLRHAGLVAVAWLLMPSPQARPQTQQKLTFSALHLCCGRCCNDLEAALRKLEGVRKVIATAPDRQVVVECDPALVSTEGLKQAARAAGFVLQDKGQGVRQAQFRVRHLCCQGCANVLSAALRRIEGVSDVAVELSPMQVTVTHDAAVVSGERIMQLAEQAGFVLEWKKPAL